MDIIIDYKTIRMIISICIRSIFHDFIREHNLNTGTFKTYIHATCA